MNADPIDASPIASGGFAALIRTTGQRPTLLLDALQSIALQGCPCLPVVIVHGDEATYAEVRRNCERSGAAGGIVILHAAKTSEKRRGYPINVGIEYCLTQRPEVEFIFFLDDDDIVYPFFTGTMESAFVASGADVVYAASNRREPGQPASAGYFPQPIQHVLRDNFIPSNSYAIRAGRLRDSGLRMTEELEYTEDWHFLICMLRAGFRFHALSATLSEFRIISDGNVPQKRDPAMWRSISLEIRHLVNTSSFPLPGPDLVRMCMPGGASYLQRQLDEREEKLIDASIRLREKTAQAAHYQYLFGEMEQKFLDAHTRFNEKAGDAQHFRNLLDEAEQKWLDANNRLGEKTSEGQHLRNLLGEMEQRFLDAANRLADASSERQHLRNLLEEMERKFLDASNRLAEASSERQHYAKLLGEKTAAAERAALLLEESRSREEALALSNRMLQEQLSSEQAAHLLAGKELAELNAKVSKFPLRLLVR